MRTFAIINQKGGCGKTTTSINLAAAFASLGQRTLLVDMDPQSHCALGLAVPEQQIDATIADALLAGDSRRVDLADIVWQISGKLDLAPSSVPLAGVEQRLGGAPDRDMRLANVLQGVANHYQVCIIDCPPSIGLLTFNALRAAGEVIIPVETGYFALQGAVKQAKTLKVIANRVGHEVAMHVLPTMYDVRTKMAREILGELRKQFGDRVLPVSIHYNAKLKEAASFGQPISEYDPACRGCQDFDQLARHLLAHPPAQRVKLEVQRKVEPVAAAAPQPVAAAPAGPSNRAAELVQRARALSRRTTVLQNKLSRDPAIAQLDAQEKRPAPGTQQHQKLQDKLQEIYGVRVTQQGTLFVQPEGEARAISVAGDFNDWSATATPMRRNERLGVWEACLTLKPGRYRYRLVIDGEWVADPHNKRTETNPFGGFNNIVEVK